MSTRKSTFFYAVLLALASLTAGMVVASRLDLTSGAFAGTLNIPVTNSAPLTGTLDASTFRNIARDQTPMVVSIVVTEKVTQRSVQNLPPGFEQFFGGQGNGGGNGSGRSAQPQEQEGAGSGFIIDKAGFILTNNHVVENADDVTVYLQGMNEGGPGLKAKVVGKDVLTDAALIQLVDMPKTPLTEAKFGDSEQMEPGDWVMAIGNPYGLSHSVSVGVVSAVGRPDENIQQTYSREVDLIQTDAAINKGNSGGPLLNIRGEVIGINNQILTDENGEGNIGIGFAVPINTIRDILPQLRTGKVVRGRIGLSVGTGAFTDDQVADFGLTSNAGALVKTVTAKGPADVAGIHLGDVIIDFNGKPVKDSAQLVSMVMATAPGTTVPVKIVRDKKPMTLNVKVEELNFDEEAAQNDATGTAPGVNPRGPRAAPVEPVSKATSLEMTVQEITPQQTRRLGLPAGTRGGAIVTEIVPRGVSYYAGLGTGDVILQVNGASVSSVDEVTKAIDAAPAGHSVRLDVWRDGGEVLVLVPKK